MYRLIIGFALFVAGCTAPVVPSFRDTSVPITSIALFDPAQFAGHWDVVASYQGRLCDMDVVALGGGFLEVAENLCMGTQSDIRARISGPGRYLAETGSAKGSEYWVMWVDQTYRTAVIGTVGGEFGMILNRGRDIPSDRLKAAREILDWNGYDLARLVLSPAGG